MFIAGARPDVRRLYPTYPLNDRAGWGFLILTNMLPNQGNGTFRIYAYAEDAEGARTLLGARTIVGEQRNGDAAVRGDRYAGAGRDDSGERVSELGLGADAAAEDHPDRRVDDPGAMWTACRRGTATYNLFRPDVSGLFPGLANSGGPVGYRVLDTTALAEGQHTMPGW